jgi:predicted nucleic acid-binding protein
MKFYILDTNILLHLVRGNKKGEEIKNYLNQQPEIQIFISIVSIAETESLVIQLSWGNEKILKLRELVNKMIVIDITKGDNNLINNYALIDAFSQGKLPAPNGQLLQTSSRNMGKNDLWIAATAYALDAVLLTTDNDFDHLNGVFFEVEKF